MGKPTGPITPVTKPTGPITPVTKPTGPITPVTPTGPIAPVTPTGPVTYLSEVIMTLLYMFYMFPVSFTSNLEESKSRKESCRSCTDGTTFEYEAKAGPYFDLA